MGFYSLKVCLVVAFIRVGMLEMIDIARLYNVKGQCVFRSNIIVIACICMYIFKYISGITGQRNVSVRNTMRRP